MAYSITCQDAFYNLIVNLTVFRFSSWYALFSTYLIIYRFILGALFFESFEEETYSDNMFYQVNPNATGNVNRWLRFEGNY